MLDKLLEKTAALLEHRADELDSKNQEKLASDRAETIQRLSPAIKRFETMSNTKLSEEQREEIYSGGNETLIGMLEKLASAESLENMGGPEELPPVFRRTQMPSQAKTAAVAEPRQLQHRSRRRSAKELKRETRQRDAYSIAD